VKHREWSAASGAPRLTLGAPPVGSVGGSVAGRLALVAQAAVADRALVRLGAVARREPYANLTRMPDVHGERRIGPGRRLRP